MKSRSLLALTILVFCAASVSAAVSLPRVLSDGLVFQRDQPIHVWGHASPGETVSVQFAGEEQRTNANDTGAWGVTLAAKPASREPREVVVTGTNRITLHDVLVGEVWLCSGQSNMEMAVGVPAAGAQAEASYNADLARELPTLSIPTVRLFRVSQQSREAGDVRSDGWAAATGSALAHFSAAGFFFGREVHAALDVPVGLIQSTWGGSRIEEWMADSAYAPLESLLGADAGRCFERNRAFVSRNYDAMIAPLAPFGLRGVLWYQGESNLISYNDGLHYADKFAALVANWRAAWSAPTLSFYAVQIAPFTYTQFKSKLPHADDELPRLWEAQRLATRMPHTGVVPISDTVTDVRNIHPGGKAVVGHRLAALALADTYGRKGIVTTGPVLRRAEFEGATALVYFDGAEGGLVTSDHAAPTEFELAGADGRFHSATAVIQGARVAVTTREVPHPVAVRFGWHETARPNLTNAAGWPAFAFRSNAPSWSPPSFEHR